VKPWSDIPLVPLEPHEDCIARLSARWGFPVRQPDADDIFILEVSAGRLQLRKRDEPKLGGVYVDFVAGINAHRRKFSGGRGQAVARSVGLTKGAAPSVVDATAGLGRDAFVLASLGCRVHMVERSPVAAALLEDGLTRARLDLKIGPWVSQRLSLECSDSCRGLGASPFKPDVVYVDPMFPEKKKPARVKKGMRVFKALIGGDPDADKLLPAALDAARKRVVVKRPARALWLAGREPHASIQTRQNRFDIYFPFRK
jgi:16S rRNA (guanine1516-N2)-methyltransferase